MNRVFFISLLSAWAVSELLAQRVPVVPGGSAAIRLPGHIPPAARKAADLGPVDPTQPIRYVSMIFNKTAAQQAELDRLLIAQRDPKSPDFRRWISPAGYADRFGLDSASVSNVRAWLESKGFSIDNEAVSRTGIAFSGSAAQVDNAFHTDLHTYRAGGKTHFAPSREPSVPQSLEPAILAIRGLNNFYGEHVRSRAPMQTPPAYSSGGGGNYLTPADVATIYDSAPLYSAGFDGTGQTIAIVGASTVDLTDISNFRTKFGLPASVPQVIAVADPGIPGDTDAQSEASLDLELSGAIARGANQIYVYSTDFGDAAAYAIDHVLAPILSMSFHSCENNFTPVQEANLAAMGQEAAAKGITWLVAAGDSGPADCDGHDVTGAVAQDGMYVNAWAAIPEVTAVGGTEFNEAATGSSKAYWNGVNGPGLGSATGYIPETVWNDSATAGYLAAGGGGSSRYFAKPSWQAGTGVPTDGARDVPDVALSASWYHDGYYICNAGVCNLGHGGTSAATPLFAGLTALLNQFLLKWGVLQTPGLGNINPTLYQLAQSSSSPSLPPSSSASNTAFHDIQTGSNTVPCLTGSADCSTGSYGYAAGAGYDLASGLGSVDATQLFNAWLASDSSLLKTTSTTVTAAPANSGLEQAISVTVTGANKTAPAGTVTLSAGAVALGSAPLVRNSASSAANFTLYNAQLPAGVTTIVALYNGNSEFLPSSGTSPIVETPAVAPKPSVQVFVNPNPVYETPAAYGTAWNFTLTLREVNGAPASLVGLKVNTIDTTQIANQAPLAVIGSWFGTTTLPAFGSISVPLQLTMPRKSPATQPWTVSALDAFGSGAGVKAPAVALATVLIPPVSVPGAIQIEVDTPGPTPTSPLTQSIFTAPLLGRPAGASLQLTGVPSAVLRNPGAKSACQWSQQLLLRDLSGTGVTLSQFIAGGTDMSASIGSLWGAMRVEANSELSATMCWSGLSVPILVDYTISGMDDNGNAVSAAMTSPYMNPPSSPNTLKVASTNPNLSGTLNLNTANGQLVFTVTTTSPSEVWTATVSTSGQNPSWLTLYPVSGSGSGSVYVTPASGLSTGTYTANILFHSTNAEPQVVSMPVTFTVP
jgi:Pro-kumamolisin, activation domain/Bacterial Ig-like domain (group 3)